MPRPPRFDLADVPQHIIQRGNNRQPTFFADADYQRYLKYLAGAAKTYGCAVHAYVLMPNHIHLLATPARSGAISKLMQSVGGRYVRYVNAAHGRSGSLWEGRYRASIVDSERYLMTCHRYIEANPLRADLVLDPADYRWSSYRRNARGETDDIVDEHALYTALGATQQDRLSAYKALFDGEIDARGLHDIRAALNQGRALAGEAFRSDLEARLERPVGPARRGRPWRTSGN